jgi:hypothetical protein
MSLERPYSFVHEEPGGCSCTGDEERAGQNLLPKTAHITAHSSREHTPHEWNCPSLRSISRW